jgi:hypothetical protein
MKGRDVAGIDPSHGIGGSPGARYAATELRKSAMNGWRITPLPDARLTEAWPLVRLQHPGWTLDTWLGEARTLLAHDGPAGLLVAETGAGYIYAVCGYRLDPSDGGLSLPLLASTRWRGSDDPLQRLTAAVEAIARDHHCSSVSVSAAVAGDTARWEQFGYEWCDHVLRKDLSGNRAQMQRRDIRSHVWP